MCKRHLYNQGVETTMDLRFPFHLGMVLAYGVLLIFEADDLVAIVEGVRNDIKEERRRSVLIDAERI